MHMFGSIRDRISFSNVFSVICSTLIVTGLSASLLADQPAKKDSNARLQPKSAAWSTKVEPSTAKPGEKVKFTASVKLQPGWHLYKSRPSLSSRMLSSTRIKSRSVSTWKSQPMPHQAISRYKSRFSISFATLRTARFQADGHCRQRCWWFKVVKPLLHLWLLHRSQNWKHLHSLLLWRLSLQRIPKKKRLNPPA